MPLFHVVLLIIMTCLYNSEAAAAAIVSIGPSQTSVAALDADLEVVAAAAAAAIVSAGPSQTNFNWAVSDSIAAFDAFVDANTAADAAAAAAAMAPSCVTELLPEQRAAAQVQFLGAVAEPISSLDAATATTSVAISSFDVSTVPGSAACPVVATGVAASVATVSLVSRFLVNAKYKRKRKE